MKAQKQVARPKLVVLGSNRGPIPDAGEKLRPLFGHCRLSPHARVICLPHLPLAESNVHCLLKERWEQCTHRRGKARSVHPVIEPMQTSSPPDSGFGSSCQDRHPPAKQSGPEAGLLCILHHWRWGMHLHLHRDEWNGMGMCKFPRKKGDLAFLDPHLRLACKSVAAFSQPGPVPLTIMSSKDRQSTALPPVRRWIAATCSLNSSLGVRGCCRILLHGCILACIFNEYLSRLGTASVAPL